MGIRASILRTYVLFLAAALLLGSCSTFGDHQQEAEREAFRELILDQRQVWDEEGFENYRYRYQIARTGDVIKTFSIEVRNGMVTEATVQGDPVQNVENRRTIEDLFDVAREAVEATTDQFRVRFDEERGYLRLLIADYAGSGVLQLQVFGNSLKQIEEEAAGEGLVEKF